MNKKIKIRRIDKSIPLPAYKTQGAVAFDLSSREEKVIKPKEIIYVPLNVNIKNPKSCAIIMAPRSSLHKMGLTLINNIGIFDEDFCGNNDEYNAAIYNFSDQPVTIEVGTRIVQAMVVPIEKVDFEEVEDMESGDRGGFGSTGQK